MQDLGGRRENRNGGKVKGEKGGKDSLHSDEGEERGDLETDVPARGGERVSVAFNSGKGSFSSVSLQRKRLFRR